MSTGLPFFHQKYIRLSAGIILATLAFNAFGGGYYGMSGAQNVPLEWLEGSLFHSYFVPSLFLFVIIGGGCLTAAIMAFQNARYARMATALCGILLIVWIAIQVSVIGYVSALQPAVFIAGMTVVILTLLWRPVTDPQK